MKIAAYQFHVTGNIENNYLKIKEGIEKASEAGARLLLFPECAVTGYPPHCIKSASEVDFDLAEQVCHRIQLMSEKYQMYIVAGTITKERAQYYNSAILFCPDGKQMEYCKRALWGWDKDNFTPGQSIGTAKIDSIKIGIRICFEIRFPEYFRELYREHTDLILALFYDDSAKEDLERYRLIKGHIQTRAVENVCYILSCNTCSPFQTAPTGLFSRSGKALAEMERGKEGLLAFDLTDSPLNFGETGRKEISDSFMKSDAF